MEKSGKFRFALVLFLLFGFSRSLAGNGSLPIVTLDGGDLVALSDLNRLGGLDNSFDIITQRGRFYRGARTAAYQVGLSVALLNG